MHKQTTAGGFRDSAAPKEENWEWIKTTKSLKLIAMSVRRWKIRPRMNEPARTVCNVKLEIENGPLGLVEFVTIHTDPPRWGVRRKYSLGAGGMVRSLPSPEMFA
jgi:hypothetical protein